MKTKRNSPKQLYRALAYYDCGNIAERIKTADTTVFYNTVKDYKKRGFCVVWATLDQDGLWTEDEEITKVELKELKILIDLDQQEN